ncbi:Ribosomal RNA large subunit methyltransferase I [[Clostridium] ultunense Esp]|nr:Ribosomal RNA large subunit methyltransferase I [[Clostridium] ultunense Esp]
MATIYLKRQRKKRLEQGHPWIYQSEVERIEGEFQPGDLVDVANHQGFFLGIGMVNPRSQIIVRLLTNRKEAIDHSFFLRRVEEAWNYRQRFLPGIRSLRVVYGEADFLPGLIVDKYEEVLVVQILSLGMERQKEKILSALLHVFHPKAIYLRNDVPVRELEGLPLEKGFWYGESPTQIEIEENGLKILVDIKEGQKTGYFFDQRENRASIAPLMNRGGEGVEVLECFTHTGSFTLNALQHGAKRVTALDISPLAIEMAKENVARNGFLEQVEFVVANAFDFLREKVKEGKKWDVVILDPPAFAKNRSRIESALRGYKEINLNALKLIRDGGFLVTSSCSSPVTATMFQEMVQDAAFDTHKILRLVRFSGAGVDHPRLSGWMKETT